MAYAGIGTLVEATFAVATTVSGAFFTNTTYAALAIRDGVAPVNANYANPDPDCDVNLVVGEPVKMKIRAALSNSLGFGGSNSSLVFRNPEEVTS